MKVYYCFVDFRKAFDLVLGRLSSKNLGIFGISKTVLLAIMRLYERVVDRFRNPRGFSDPIQSTLGVKQGCPFSPTLLGIFIDEHEAFLYDFSLPSDGYYLHYVLISISLFVNDVFLLASSPKGLQWLLDGLASFCDSR